MKIAKSIYLNTDFERIEKVIYDLLSAPSNFRFVRSNNHATDFG